MGKRRANAWLGAASLSLACVAGLLGGGTAHAVDHPNTLEDPQLAWVSCVTSGDLPWLGNVDAEFSGRVAGEGGGSASVRFKLWRGGEPDTPVVDAFIPVSVGGTAQRRVPREEIPEGADYWWQARLEDENGTSEWTTPCGFRPDQTPPATPTVTFTDAAQYPDGAPGGVPRTVRFDVPAGTEVKGFCFDPERMLGVSEDDCDSQWVPAEADGTATATFVSPERSGPSTLYAQAVDRAGNISGQVTADYRVAHPFIERFGDYDSDGRADLLGVGADGKLTLRAGQEAGGFAAPVVADGRDWSGALVARASWLLARNGNLESYDVRNDLVALQGGKLFAYPGNGEGGFGTPVEITGYDWSRVTGIALNRTESQIPLLLAKEGDRLLLFELNTYGRLTVGAPSVLAESGWASKTVHFADGPEDGLPFFWARDTRRGTLQHVPVEYGTSQPWALGTPTTVAASGWSARQRPSVAAVGDVDGDGRTDLISGTRKGALVLHPAAENGSLGAPTTLQPSGRRGVTFF
ncbi:hypothetical protein [Streptomyces sp. NPDC046182]|uniref:hypothetical protein n=1 Tax=Streptomyces sp. NPDC046182 TaxID=3154601 RepID=UPI0033F07F49